jgi:large subunit ribosomal protein L19e
MSGSNSENISGPQARAARLRAQITAVAAGTKGGRPRSPREFVEEKLREELRPSKKRPKPVKPPAKPPKRSAKPPKRSAKPPKRSAKPPKRSAKPPTKRSAKPPKRSAKPPTRKPRT